MYKNYIILKSCVVSIDIIFMYKNYIIFKVAGQTNLIIFPILKLQVLEQIDKCFSSFSQNLLGADATVLIEKL
jgi:hypothetical protein